MGCAAASHAVGPEEIVVPPLGRASAAPERRFLQAYALGRQLGQGSFGTVRAARQLKTQKECAVKILDTRGPDPVQKAPEDAERARAARNELQLWARIPEHRNVLALRDSFVHGTFYYLVMDLCGCSLMQMLTERSDVSEKMVVGVFREMLQGIAHVHAASIVHRDIKPDNFLLGADGTTVKLCDFGLSAPLPTRGSLKGICGTGPYMSPEMLQGRSYGASTDVWSFGTIAYLVLHGEFPYQPADKSNASMKRAIMQGVAPIPFVRLPAEDLFFGIDAVRRAAPFLRSLLQRSPEHRPSAEEALRLSYLAPVEGASATPLESTSGSIGTSKLDIRAAGDDDVSTNASVLDSPNSLKAPSPWSRQSTAM